MKLFHKLLAVGCAAAMLCASCLAVSAQAVPDLTRSDCAILLTMRENG